MNLQYFKTNIVHCWLTTPGMIDFIKRLFWTYSVGLPKFLCPSSMHIRFTYSQPFGKLAFDVRTNDSDSFIFGEVFDHHFYEIPLPSRPHTIIDLGANVGFVSIYYAIMYPDAEIACVEPIPWNVEKLRKNLQLNGIEANVFPVAIATKNGFVDMDIHEKDFGHKVAMAEQGDDIKKIRVESITVETLMNILGWDNIDLLKIDIEGYEKELFNSNISWLNKVKNICIEIHDDFSEIDLLKIKDDYGFFQLKRVPGLYVLSR